MCCSTKKSLGLQTEMMFSNKTISEYQRLIDSGMIPSEVISSLLVKKSRKNTRKSKIKNIFNLND